MNRTTFAYRIVPLLVVAALTCSSLRAAAPPDDNSAPAKPDTATDPFSPKPKTTVAQQPSDLEIYRLKHADPKQAMAVLQTILADGASDVRFSLDAKTSAIIVLGPREIHQKVAELLKSLDVSPWAESTQLKIFHLVHANPAPLAKVLAAIGPKDVRLATDERTKSLVAVGSPDDLRVAEALVLRLDQEERIARDTRYEVRVVWLAAGLPSEKPGEPPAEDMKDVLAELSRLGIKDPRQVGQVVVQTTTRGDLGGTFRVKSSPRFGDETAEFSASGTLSERPDSALAMQIQISTRKQSSPPEQSLNEVQTQIILPQKQFVVLATAPVANQTSIFVVQVTSATKAEKKSDNP